MKTLIVAFMLLFDCAVSLCIVNVLVLFCVISVLPDDDDHDDDDAGDVYRGCYAYNPNKWGKPFTYSKMTPDYCKGFCKFELWVSNNKINN